MDLHPKNCHRNFLEPLTSNTWICTHPTNTEAIPRKPRSSSDSPRVHGSTRASRPGLQSPWASSFSRLAVAGGSHGHELVAVGVKLWECSGNSPTIIITTSQGPSLRPILVDVCVCVFWLISIFGCSKGSQPEATTFGNSPLWWTHRVRVLNGVEGLRPTPLGGFCKKKMPSQQDQNRNKTRPTSCGWLRNPFRTT